MLTHIEHRMDRQSSTLTTCGTLIGVMIRVRVVVGAVLSPDVPHPIPTIEVRWSELAKSLSMRLSKLGCGTRFISEKRDV